MKIFCIRGFWCYNEKPCSIWTIKPWDLYYRRTYSVSMRLIIKH